MVSNNQFQQNRAMQSQQQLHQQQQYQQYSPQQQQQNTQQRNNHNSNNNNLNNSNNNPRAAAAPYRKPFRPGNNNNSSPGGNGNANGNGNGNNGNGNNGNQMMFSSSQMPSDPLYIDFNNPSPGNKQNQGDGLKKKPLKGIKQQYPNSNQLQGKMNNQNNNKQMNQQQPPFNNQMNGGGWQSYPNNNPNLNRGFNGFQRGPPPNRPPGRHMMGPPMGPMGPGPGPRGPGPIGGPGGPYPQMPFQPPMPGMRGPPMPPMGGPPPPPPPHFMRRNGPGPGPMMGGPPPMHMMGPRMPPRGMPPGPFGPMNMNGGRIMKPNPKLIKQAVKGKSSIKTLKNLINQYPIDKPWVTDEIRAEHAKKTDIENRLKGHKDDELFAQYKGQRDKFVGLYEAAREEYLKQEAASVKAKPLSQKLGQHFV
ncbi:DNA-binding protein K10 isoform X2 [Drosophila ficusphila]|uniref:DNA-binding protein K10 isoform X2 n=1 Tax=Drosophila ficusphila TaxID=30025 RepID=UPI0007E72040|nr:DNA-binding protein K10 isoform X2 [Drosophila ficusphila]